MPTDPTPQLTGDAELVAEARDFLAEFGHVPRQYDCLLIDRLATRLASLSAELEGARKVLESVLPYAEHDVRSTLYMHDAKAVVRRARAFLSPNPAPVGRVE